MNKGKLLSFGDYLKELPADVFFKHLVKDVSVKRKIISTDLVDTIHKKFTSKEFCKKLFDALSPEAQKVCSLAYLFGANGIKAIEYEAFHEVLMTSFLLYVASDHYETQFYFGFSDIAQVINPICATFLSSIAKDTPKGKPVSFLKQRCLNDFTALLVMALNTELKKKKDGVLIQAAMTQIKNVLHTTLESCSFEKKDKDVAAIVQMLLAYGKARHYLTEDDQGFSTTHSQISQWLACPAEESYKDIITFARNHSGAWNMSCMQALLEEAGEDWLGMSVFPLSCKDQAYSMLRMLHYCGIIETITQGNSLWWRKCPVLSTDSDAATAHKGIVLPDFSVILPQEVVPEVLYAFALLGRLNRLDKVYKGMIDRELVYNSLSKNVDGEVILAHLTQWDAPVNVIETVKEWIREFSRLCIIRSDVIVSFDQKTSRQLSGFDALSELIVPLEADTVYVIKKGREQEVKDILVSSGFDPRVPEIEVPKPEPIEAFFTQTVGDELVVSYNFDPPKKADKRPVSSGKYSHEMKELETNELFHVIDYAILMSHAIKIEYDGSPYIRQGTYTITPISIVNETEPFIEGKSDVSGAVKKYYIKRIKRIGVLA